MNTEKKTNNCQHPLTGVCAAINAVEYHLNNREFMSSTLTTRLLPESAKIAYKSNVSNIARDDARALVTYAVGEINITEVPSLDAVDNSTVTNLAGSIVFNVSTTSEALTAELAMEIAMFLWAMNRSLMEANFRLTQTTVSPLSRDVGNYYVANVTVSAALGQPMWKNAVNECILREIGIKEIVV